MAEASPTGVSFARRNGTKKRNKRLVEETIRYWLAPAISSDRLVAAELRPWWACVVAGVVLLVMASLLPSSAGDAGMKADSITQSELARDAMELRADDAAPPRAPFPAGMAPSCAEATRGPNARPAALGELFALGAQAGSVAFEARATRADPQAILTTGSRPVNAAKDTALAVLAHNLVTQNGAPAHSAGPGYDEPWIRDSFAWGMIPSNSYPQLSAYSSSELRWWLGRQAPSGQWISNPQSGYFDETAILISAALDAYRISGDRALLAEALPRLRRGWAWLRSNTNGPNSTYLLWTPLPANGPRLALPVAVDWADQVGRRNYAGQLNLLWFRATQSMAVAEQVLGNSAESNRYGAFAAGIRSDFNRMFWTVGAIQSRNAAPAAPFGHYRSWLPAERDYFELDTNLEAIVYGVADDAQRASILGFVDAHAPYLLGTPGGAPPARTLYGDYDPADYAQIRNKLGDGLYHNAYWLSIGGLVAAAYQQAEQPAMQRRIIEGMAAAMGTGQGAISASEWYDGQGIPGGVPAYQWSARSFLHTLFGAYSGMDADWASADAENLRVLAPAGDAHTQLVHLGKRLSIVTHGSGRVVSVRVDGQVINDVQIVPEALLHDGGTIELVAGEQSGGDGSGD